MTKITVETIMQMNPCEPAYTPGEIKKLLGGRPISLKTLDAIDIPTADKIWLLLHEEILPAKELRLFAYREAAAILRKVKMTDSCCWDAIKIARRYAHGRVSAEELAAAGDAAWAAAWYAAWAAGYAAWAAAWAAARKRQYAAIKRLVRKHNPELQNLKKKSNGVINTEKSENL